MAVIIKNRRDTLTNWQSINPVLALGEIAVIVDSTNKATGMKIGDGVKNFTTLSMFLTGTSMELAGDVLTITSA